MADLEYYDRQFRLNTKNPPAGTLACVIKADNANYYFWVAEGDVSVVTDPTGPIGREWGPSMKAYSLERAREHFRHLMNQTGARVIK